MNNIILDSGLKLVDLSVYDSKVMNTAKPMKKSVENLSDNMGFWCAHFRAILYVVLSSTIFLYASSASLVTSLGGDN